MSLERRSTPNFWKSVSHSICVKESPSYLLIWGSLFWLMLFFQTILNWSLRWGSAQRRVNCFEKMFVSFAP